ncbi:hypothetical protein KIN20_014042 [Parelaphostrongylus tenuis]|uniref:Uncharacterized protein n=1 Tax=Parelaphostrongylus tenuis TaxID=148309 RepID=A0AAD5MD05_PARTN|nr:hypothetical protein KIN20_014042 [Parelaphostrongylus tenuis]
MTDTTTPLKIAYCKLYFGKKQRFTLDYNEKDDLYRSFQNKIDELGIPSGSTFWADIGCGSVQIKDADTLFAIVNHCPRVKIVVRTENEHSSSSSDSAEESHGLLARKHRAKNRSRTRSHSRGRSRSHSRDRHRMRHHCTLRNLCHSYPRDLRPHRCRRQTHSPGFYNENTLDLDSSNDRLQTSAFPHRPIFHAIHTDTLYYVA